MVDYCSTALNIKREYGKVWVVFARNERELHRLVTSHFTGNSNVLTYSLVTG